jgi:hypothetical protein
MDQEPVNFSWEKNSVNLLQLKAPDSNLAYTSVIQLRPWRSYPILNSSFVFRVPKASVIIFHHIVDMAIFQRRNLCECKAHMTDPEVLYSCCEHGIYTCYRGRRGLRTRRFYRLPCLTDAIAKVIGFLFI